MVDSDYQDRIWAALSDHRVCMMTTLRDGAISTRPMSGHVDRENHRILFVVSRLTFQAGEAAEPQQASIAISEEDDNFYATIACQAAELDDRELLKNLWSPITSAWFPNGPDDPDVVLMALDPVSAEIWNGPSSGMVIAFKLATARILGRTPDLGVNATVDMR